MTHLYQRCSVCNGTRRTPHEIRVTRPTSGYTLPAGAQCPCCADGYVLVGLTLGQVEAMQKTIAEQKAKLLALAEQSELLSRRTEVSA